MPAPHKGENLSHFMGRFMGSEEAKESFPKRKQRIAVAENMYRSRKKKSRHDDEAEDRALIRREVKASALRHK